MTKVSSDTITIPNKDEALVAHKTASKLASVLDGQSEDAILNISLNDLAGKPKKEENFAVPVRAMSLLLNILREMAQGRAVTLVPHHAEFTTQQAADFLNVSRPFVVKLIDDNQLPAHRVGRHRRIRFDDLLQYQRLMSHDRKEALEALTEETEKLGIKY